MNYGKKNIKQYLKIKTTKGFAILFAVLLSSFLITLGVSIFSISLKEIQITTSLRDSQIAYYIADSARECALYWDIKKGAFPACLDDTCSVQNPQINPITCNGNDIFLIFIFDNNLSYTTNKTDFFQASSTSSSTPISDIKIIKEFIDPNIVTTIEARGHNTGILGRRVERGIQMINNE
ncbi:MAG: hypothetical protein V1910_00520 [bacterium]